MNDTQNLKTLPLENLHIAANAKFGGFAGWNMPLTYPLGVMKEHLFVRSSAGLFDISHMKLILVEGEDAAAFFAHAMPIDVEALNAGQSRYNFLLSEEGGILDDVIVTRLGENRYMIVANAGNADADIALLHERARAYNCKIEPLDRVLLAFQGPEAINVLRELKTDFGFSLSDVVDKLVFMHGVEPKQGWFITRSGYTGEDGFEIAMPLSEGHAFAQALLADPRVEWIGLAARDSLRLEAGLCLHGNDIDDNITPVEAGVMFAITKPVRESAQFIGAQAVLDAVASAATGATRRRVGLEPEGRQPARAGVELFDKDGTKIGEVTSGGFGPSFEGPIAMGYVDNAFKEIGTKVYANIRGKELALVVHALPFVPHHYFKG